jgi:hypothetical protein
MVDAPPVFQQTASGVSSEQGSASIRAFAHRGRPRGQRGWVGLIVILLALAVVALLAQMALKQYGLPGVAAPTKAGVPGERARAVGAEVPGAATAPAAALERARGVEDLVKQHAEERASRDDGTAK